MRLITSSIQRVKQKLLLLACYLRIQREHNNEGNRDMQASVIILDIDGTQYF